MPPPVLHQTYSRAEALGGFGEAASATTHCDGEWIGLPGRMIGFTEVGLREPDIHFCNATRYHWYARKPFPEAKGGPFPCIPRGLRKANELGNEIHLFVRFPGADDRFAYVGPLEEPSYGTELEHPHGYAMFELQHPLPAALWERLGGLYQHPGGHAAFDRAIQTIAAASTPHERFTGLQQLIEFWRGPLKPEEGMTAEETDIAMPAVLDSFYRWAGKCRDLMQQRHLSFPTPMSLSARNGRIDIVRECQDMMSYVVKCSDWSQQDPPVAEQSEDGRTPIGTLSEFLVWFFVSGLIADSPYERSWSLSEAQWEAFRSVIPRAPVVVYRNRWPDCRIGYHAGRGLLASAWREKGVRKIAVAAKSETDLDAIESQLGLKPDA